MTRRRPLLLTFAAVLWTPAAAMAVQRKSMADPMRLGVERSLLADGLATRLQRGFGRDTGVAVQLVPGTSASVLTALEQGEIDAALTDAPELETRLEKQGLAHDRRLIATGDLLLVGPVSGQGRKRVDPAGVMGERDISAALQRVAQAKASFVSAPEGSGAYLAELNLWRAAQTGPVAPWYTKTPEKDDALALAAAQSAYTLVERGRWMAQGPRALSVLVQGDPRMSVPVHFMQSFRSHHPAAKLFSKWISGGPGRRVVAGARGWQSPPPAGR